MDLGRTVGKIITDIAENKSPDDSAEDIVSKHVGDAVTDSTRHLIGKLRDRGLKRARRVTPKNGGKKHKKTPAKRDRVLKRDKFS